MRRTVFAATVAAAVAVSACGGGDDSGLDAAPDQAPAATETTPAGAGSTGSDTPLDGPSLDGPSPDATTPSSDVAGSNDEATDIGAPDDTVAAVDVPELLRFTSTLVGGGEFDATTTAGSPTAFWFWSPT